jgi:zinc protease
MNPYAMEKPMSKRLFRFFLGALIISGFLALTGQVVLNNSGGVHPFPILETSRVFAAELAQKPAWPQSKSDLAPDPNIIYGRLENGLRYVLLKNSEPKDRVSMHLNVQAGSLHETENERGLAHFLEHMVFDGSTHFPPGELVKYFQSIGMQFGPDANAHTGFNETVYDILLPDGGKKHFLEALVVIRDFAEGALLLEEEVKKERGVVLAEKRTRDSASYRTFKAGLNFEFPKTRIIKRLPIGTDEVISKADRKSVKAYYDAWYRPEKLILVVVGDFDTSLATRLIKDQFNTLKPRASARDPFEMGAPGHTGLKTFHHHEKEAGNTDISIQVAKGIKPRKDTRAYRKKMLARNVANSIVHNRLELLVAKPESPFTSASIGGGVFLRKLAYAGIQAESSPEKWAESLQVLENVLRQALIFGFTPAEVERAKKELSADLEEAVKKATTRDSRRLARGIIADLNAERVTLAPQQEKALYAPLVKALTPKSVHAAFKRLWAPDHRLVSVTGNADLAAGGADPQQLIRKTFEKSQIIAVAKPEALKEVVFPYLLPPEKSGSIIVRNRLDDLGIEQIQFENGVRLNLKKTDFKADEIIVNLIFGHGRDAEPEDKAGVLDLAAAVVNESGLGALNKENLARALAGKTTRVSFSTGGQWLAFGGQTSPAEIEHLFTLLHTHLQDPAYRPAAYELSLKRFGQMYQALDHSIDGNIRLKGWRFLAGGDTRFGMAPYERFKTLTLDDVRNAIDQPLKEAPLEISMVGDFNLETVITLAARYLGGLPVRKKLTPIKRPGSPRFPAGASKTIDVATKIPKALAIVAYATDDFWDIKRSRRLSILAEVFSERLRLSLRERLGATYSPAVFNRASRAYRGYGAMQAFVHVAPEQVDLVVTEVRRIAADLAQKGVTADELRRALDPTLTSLKDMRKTNSYWLNSVLTGSTRFPQQLAWSRSIMDDYAAITAAELSRLAQKYLQAQNSALVVIRPAKP